MREIEPASSKVPDMRIPRSPVPLLLLAAAVAPGTPALAQETYGGAWLSGIYSSSENAIEDEEIDGSAIAGRVHGGLRWNPGGDTTRIEAASSYYAYFERDDRWSNAIEIEQQFRAGDRVRIGFEAAAATNVSTLEARSVDQLSGAARVRYEAGPSRLILSGGTRRRDYDHVDARSWAPFVDADYRHRLGRYQYIDVEARHEWIDSNLNSLDYRRLRLAAFYTHPLGGETRLRVGAAHRRWSWDERLTAAGAPLRDRIWVPQARITHGLAEDIDLELDYRRVIRRSNDPQFDRDGNRLAATVRIQF